MTGSASVVWDDALAAYDFGAGHPLAPIRVQLAMHLARDLGLLDNPDVTVIAPDPIVTVALTGVAPNARCTTSSDPPQLKKVSAASYMFAPPERAPYVAR